MMYRPALSLSLLGALALQSFAADPPRVDLYGDPLPAGAVARLGTIRLRHGGHRASMHFTPDGSTLITGGDDRSVRLWDVATGRMVKRLREAEGTRWVFDIALAPDGRTLAVAGSKGVSIWDTVKGQELRRFHRGAIHAVAFTPQLNGLLTASSEQDGGICLLDHQSGRELWRYRTNDPDIAFLQVTSDGKYAVCAIRSSRVHLLELATGRGVRTAPSRGGTASVFAVSPDGKALAVTSLFYERTQVGPIGRLDIVDLETGAERKQIVGRTSPIVALAYSPDGKHVATTDLDQVVHLWDVESGKEVRRYAQAAEGEYNYLKRLVYSPDGKVLAGARGGPVLELWDAATGKLLHENLVHATGAGAPVFLADGKSIVTGGYGQACFGIWDRRTGRLLRKINRCDGAYASNPLLTPDGKQFLTAMSDGTIRVWDPETGRTVRRLDTAPSGKRRREEAVGSTKFTVSGNSLIAVRRGPYVGDQSVGYVALEFDLGSGREIAKHEVPGRYYSAEPGLSPDGKLVSLVSYEALIITDRKTGAEVLHLKRKPEAIFNGPCAISPDGKHVAVRCTGLGSPDKPARAEDFALRIFDLQTGKERAQFHVYLERVEGHHVFSPDSRWLAYASNQAIHVLSVETGKELWRSPEPNADTLRLQFDSTGSFLASSHMDMTVLVWDLAHLKAREGR